MFHYGPSSSMCKRQEEQGGKSHVMEDMGNLSERVENMERTPASARDKFYF